MHKIRQRNILTYAATVLAVAVSLFFTALQVCEILPKNSRQKIYKNCDNIPIKKELLENIISDTINKVVKTPKIIESLAEKIMEAHKKRVAEDSMQKYLEENLRDTEKAISNLISCMEQGIVSNSTKQRLLELSRFTLFRNCKEQNDNHTQ